MVSANSIGEARFREALRRFATGVVIVTARNTDGQPRAITINAFSSVSLDPPLILYCLDKSAYHFSIFVEAKSFAVNILSADQQALSNRFAAEVEDDLADLSIKTLQTGSPILTGCLTALDCTTEMQYQAGDHLIIIGRVSAIDQIMGGEPLLYFESGYRGLR